MKIGPLPRQLKSNKSNHSYFIICIFHYKINVTGICWTIYLSQSHSFSLYFVAHRRIHELIKHSTNSPSVSLYCYRVGQLWEFPPASVGILSPLWEFTSFSHPLSRFPPFLQFLRSIVVLRVGGLGFLLVFSALFPHIFSCIATPLPKTQPFHVSTMFFPTIFPLP